MMQSYVIPVAIALVIGASVPTSASTVYSLDLISKAKIGSGEQGTVTLTQDGPDQVDVTVSLSPGVLLVNTGGPHTPFVFNLAPSVAGATVTVSSANTPATFFAASGQQPATPYGMFTNGIGYNGSNGGVGHGSAGPLTFTVFFASGIKISDFVTNSGGYYFAADVYGTGRYTGSVAANSFVVSENPLPTPLPGALWLFGTVFAACVGGSHWHKKKQMGSATVAPA
jgi:hypothetical protein